jgi:cytoskeletal protein CcmA (bactofilin family)
MVESNSKITNLNIKNLPSIIAKDLKINGELKSTGLIEIEGNIIGNIKSNTVTIRESGFVNGEIQADVLNVKGRFDGKIKVKTLNISEKANITGTMEYSILSVEDGAFIDGTFKCIEIDEKTKGTKGSKKK